MGREKEYSNIKLLRMDCNQEKDKEPTICPADWKQQQQHPKITHQTTNKNNHRSQKCHAEAIHRLVQLVLSISQLIKIVRKIQWGIVIAMVL